MSFADLSPEERRRISQLGGRAYAATLTPEQKSAMAERLRQMDADRHARMSPAEKTAWMENLRFHRLLGIATKRALGERVDHFSPEQRSRISALGGGVSTAKQFAQKTEEERRRWGGDSLPLARAALAAKRKAFKPGPPAKRTVEKPPADLKASSSRWRASPIAATARVFQIGRGLPQLLLEPSLKAFSDLVPEPGNEEDIELGVNPVDAHRGFVERLLRGRRARRLVTRWHWHDPEGCAHV